MLLGTTDLMTQDDDGESVRGEDAYRDWVRADESTEFPAVFGRLIDYPKLRNGEL